MDEEYQDRAARVPDGKVLSMIVAVKRMMGGIRREIVDKSGDGKDEGVDVVNSVSMKVICGWDSGDKQQTSRRGSIEG